MVASIHTRELSVWLPSDRRYRFVTPSPRFDPGPDQRLTLSLLGAPEITGAGAELASGLLVKPKALALLAFLGLSGRTGFRHRDEVLALLWPKSDTARAQNALRQGLFLLRKHLPTDALVSRGSDEIGLAPRCVRVDVAVFAEHLGHRRETEALALYRGALLDGFHLYSDSDFMAWLVMERARQQQHAVRAAVALARRYAMDGDVAGMGSWLDFARTIAPHDEDLLRSSIELHRDCGDAAGAAQRYGVALERFRNDLGITLSPETTRAGQLLGDGRTPSVSAVPAKFATTPALRRPRAVSSDARHLHLQARQLASQRSPTTIMKAIASFERAIEASPEYAEAHAGLGMALCQAVAYVDHPGSDVWPRAKAHASRACELDPQLGEAHAVLAHVTLCYDYDWTAADAHYRRVLALDPRSATTRHSYALYFLTASGRAEEALGVLDRARDDTPTDPTHSVYYAMCALFDRRFMRALQEADFVLESSPTLFTAHWVRGMALEALGDLTAAIETFEAALAMTERSSIFLWQLGRASASAGDRARATTILDELEQRGGDSGSLLYARAEILAAMGDIEGALDLLYLAYRRRSPHVIFCAVKPALDPLRATRRFRDLLARMRLPRLQGGCV